MHDRLSFVYYAFSLVLLITDNRQKGGTSHRIYSWMTHSNRHIASKRIIFAVVIVSITVVDGIVDVVFVHVAVVCGIVYVDEIKVET